MPGCEDKCHKNSSPKIKQLVYHEFSMGELTENDDGSKVYHDVPLIMEGTWTDSIFQMPTHYSAKVLKKYHDNWEARNFNLDHSHRSLDQIGEVGETKFKDKTIFGDVRLHGKTHASREAMVLMDEKLVTGISVEVFTKDVWDEDLEAFRADYLEFYGAALVVNPACEGCHLEQGEAIPDEEIQKEIQERREMIEKPGEAPPEDGDPADNEKLLEKAKAEIHELSEQAESLETEKAELGKVLAAKLEDKDKEITELKTKVEELEREPARNSMPAGGEGGKLEFRSEFNTGDGEITRKLDA